MGNPFFVSQELIDVLAVSMEQILTVSDSNDHGVQFIRVERKKKTGKADENEQPLPESALR
jgi:hypothetical protein